jgi:hypothetical protein
MIADKNGSNVVVAANGSGFISPEKDIKKL